MGLKYAAFLALAVCAGGWHQPPTSGLDLSLLDPTVRPQDDLFRAANGNWIARTTLGPATNMSAFYDAFAVTRGDRMFRDPAERVSFW